MLTAIAHYWWEILLILALSGLSICFLVFRMPSALGTICGASFLVAGMMVFGLHLWDSSSASQTDPVTWMCSMSADLPKEGSNTEKQIADELAGQTDRYSKLPHAIVSFNIPGPMLTGEARVISATLEVASASGEGVRPSALEDRDSTNSLKTPTRQVIEIPVSSQMMVELHATGFTVSPFTDPTQKLGAKETNWSWQLTANSGGHQELVFVTYALVPKAESAPDKIQVGVYKQAIDVSAPPMSFDQRIDYTLGKLQQFQAVITAAMTGATAVLGFLLVKLRKMIESGKDSGNRRESEADPEPKPLFPA